jgi:hypothetical protein
MTVSYQTDGGGYAALTSSIAIDATGKQESAYTSIPASIRDLRVIKARASGGNGSASPVVKAIAIMVKP